MLNFKLLWTVVLLATYGTSIPRPGEKQVQDLITQKILLPDIAIYDTTAGENSLSIACRIPVKSTAMLVMYNHQRDTVGLFTIVVADTLKSTGIRYMFNKADWIIWKVFPSTYIGKVQDKVSLELIISSEAGEIWAGEFGTFRGKRPMNLARSYVDPEPVSTNNSAITFHYRIDADADVQIEVVPVTGGAGKPVYTDKKVDLAAGLRQYRWDLKDNEGKTIKAGEYYIRLRCRARNRLQEVNDICLPFRVTA